MPGKAGSTLIVVVDDDAPIRALLCQLLQSKGYGVVGCSNGSDALSEIRRLRPHAVTLDLDMPGMDGAEVLAQMADEEATASVPVVVVSAYPSARRLRTHRQVMAVLQKPFDVDRLFLEVGRAVSGPIRVA